MGDNWEVGSHAIFFLSFSYVLFSASFDDGNMAITGEEDFDVVLD